MARQKTTVKIEGGRDDGKVFLMEEPGALAAERWAHKALLAVLKHGKLPETEELKMVQDIDWTDENTANLGMGLVAAMGLRAFGGLDYEDAAPLLAELLDCVKIIADPKNPDATTRALFDGDIEDIKTLTRLRMEVFTLITGFSMTGVLSRLTRGGGTPPSPDTTPPNSSDGQTSQTP